MAHLSGLHLLETLPVDERTERLGVMLSYLHEIPLRTISGHAHVMTHLELASIGSADLLRDLATRVVPRVDSLGLNEQELGGMYLLPSLSSIVISSLNFFLLHFFLKGNNFFFTIELPSDIMCHYRFFLI
jgi:ADP-dependent phosphofructokinase/glucokinase